MWTGEPQHSCSLIGTRTRGVLLSSSLWASAGSPAMGIGDGPWEGDMRPAPPETATQWDATPREGTPSASKPSLH